MGPGWGWWDGQDLHCGPSTIPAGLWPLVLMSLLREAPDPAPTLRHFSSQHCHYLTGSTFSHVKSRGPGVFQNSE